MPFQPFHERFPELAAAETRSITLLKNSTVGSLPPGDYGFFEMFCNEAGCDCRRVFFTVLTPQSKNPEAVIAYGWESKKFYRDWLRQGTEEDIAMLQGPELNMCSIQGKHADEILRLFTQTLLPQKAYIERVKRHYRLFRSTVDKPRNTLLRHRRLGG